MKKWNLAVDGMFKKMVVLAVATLMVLSPMAALTVTWSDVQSVLQSGSSYNEGGIKAEKVGDAVTVTGNGGTITDLEITEPGSYTFAGTITIDGKEPWIKAVNDGMVTGR